MPQSQHLLRPSSVLCDAAGQALLRLPSHWNGFRLNLYRSGANDECGATHIEQPTLLLGLVGCQGRRWHRENGRMLELGAGPGMFDLYGRDYQREWSRWELSPGMTVAVTLSSDVLGALAPDGPNLALPTVHGASDPKLQWLVREMVGEAQSGGESGALYAQGLSCALLARLVACYGLREPQPSRSGGLSPSHRLRIRDFIEAHLGEELSVSMLAEQVAMSPVHFARCFATTFGQPPHRYVQQRRVEVAKRLLTATSDSIADIATALGFYSHSHFTRVFRQWSGTTPSRLRGG